MKILVYLVVVSIFVAMVLTGLTPEVDTTPFQPNRPIKSIPELDTGKDFIKDLRDTVSSAYQLYFTKCAGHDEIRPISNVCKDTFGFSATLIESLEVLRLLNLTDQFQQSKAWLEANFDCMKLKWVNRHELWSRAIAGLMGTYILTGDTYFLAQSEICASRSLEIGLSTTFPPPYMNMETGKFRERVWRNGTSLAEAGAGIPELISLSYLTNNASYARFARKYLKHLPRPSELLPDLYSIPHGYKATTLSGLDALTIGFYRNMALAYTLRPDRIIAAVLRASMGSVHVWPDENRSMYAPLFDAQSALASMSDPTLYQRHVYRQQNDFNDPSFQNFGNVRKKRQNQNGKNQNILLNLKFEGDSRLLDELMSDMGPPYKVFEPGSERSLGGFRFDGSILRVLLRDAVSGQLGSREKMVSLWHAMKERLKQENGGFSGVLHSNEKKFKLDDIMHESFFCQWGNAFALLAEEYQQIALTSKFNERGHIINCEAIIPPINWRYL